MTLNKMIYEVWELLRRNIVDDDEIDERLIKDLIIEQYQTWIKNEVNKTDDYEKFSTPLGYYTFTPDDGSFDIVIDVDTKVLVSTTTLPKFIYRNGKPVITVIQSPDVKSIPIKLVKQKGLWSRGNSRFNSRQIFALHIKNLEKLFLVSNDSNNYAGIGRLYLEGVLENPTDLSAFDPDTTEFPLTDGGWTYIQDYVLNKLIGKIKSTEDKDNNSTNDYIQERAG